MGEEMANQATKLFTKPILLEFEKIYFPLMMFKKKMYAGKMYEGDFVKGTSGYKHKMDIKGIVVKRRDNPNITKIAY